jgi:hypothetical protein
MKDRCIHIVDEISLLCKKCGGPWHIIKNDTRPYHKIQEEKYNGKQYQS